MGATEKPWTEKHVAQARAVFCDAAKTSIVRGSDNGTRALNGVRHGSFGPWSEEGFRRYLSYLDGFGQNSAIDAAVRRVRARAEGREVVEVETFYRVKLANGRYAQCSRGVPIRYAGRDDIEKLTALLRTGARVVRVTLTRRRMVRAEKA